MFYVCIQARMKDWRTPAWAASVKRSRGATWREDVLKTTVACLELPSSTGWTLASPHSNWMTPTLMEVSYCLLYHSFAAELFREHDCMLIVKEKYMELTFYNDYKTCTFKTQSYSLQKLKYNFISKGTFLSKFYNMLQVYLHFSYTRWVEISLISLSVCL